MSKPKIKICIGSSCFARGNDKNVDLIENFLAANQLKDEVDLQLEGCLCFGKCAEGPIVIIDEKVYTHVSKEVFLDILKKTFNK